MNENKLDKDYIYIKNNKVFCPKHDLHIVEKHPKIYLKLNTKITTACPYCGTKYKQKKTN